MPQGHIGNRQPPADSPYTVGPKDGETGLIKEPAPPSTSELEELRQAVAELQRSSAVREEQFARIKRELEENQQLVNRLLGQGENIDVMAMQTRWRQREEARRRVYKMVAGKRVVIQLHLNEDPRKNYPVHLNLNGKFYDVPRGVPFELEGEFLEVLDHAYVTHITREVNESGNPYTKILDYYTYPYEVLSGLEGAEASDRIASRGIVAQAA